MFEVGDFIVYGNNGVCKIKEIGALDSPGISKDRIYYTLESCYTAGNKIFTPADNKKVIKRPVISREEAMNIIDDIDNIDVLWIPDEKKRELNYKESVKKCDCRELVKIIKTIYLRKQIRLAEGKKVMACDEKYFRIAEDNLFGELAVSLEMTKEEVKEFVIARVEKLAALKG